jgi:hypothetical protein
MQVIINLLVPYKPGISCLTEKYSCVKGKSSNFSDVPPPVHVIFTVLLVHYRLDTEPLLSFAQEIVVDLHSVGRYTKHSRQRSGENHIDPVINMSVCHCMT